MENTSAMSNAPLYVIPATAFGERRRDPNWPEHLQVFRTEYPEGCIVKRQLGITKGRAVMQVQIFLRQDDVRPAAEGLSCCYATGDLSPYIQEAQDDALSQAFFELGLTSGLSFTKDGQVKPGRRHTRSAQQDSEKSQLEVSTEDEKSAPPMAEKPEAPTQDEARESKILPMPSETKSEAKEEPEAELSKFSGDMSEEEIYERITADEARKVPIPTGNYKGKELGETLELVPGMLDYYATLTGTGDNLFHAAVKKLYHEEQKRLAG